MSFPRHRVRPQHGVYALGALCLGLGLAHLATEGEGLGTGLEAFVICAIALLVVVTGYELPERPISRSGQWRALRRAVSVAGAFALLALAVWLIWLVEGDQREFVFLLAFATTLGSAVGIRGGLYAVEADEWLCEARDLAKLLTINQRVLRHNLRNDLSVALGNLNKIERRDHGAETTEDARTAREHLESLLETTDRTREIVSIWNTGQRETFRLRADRTGAAVVEVADTGAGIPQFNVEAIEGSEETPLVHTQGLGLWIIYWTVETSDGTFELLENEPTGTVIRITLPTADEA